MDRYVKPFLRVCFFVSGVMLYIYGWTSLSVLAVYQDVMADNIIFYSGLIYGALWIFEKQFAVEVKDE